MSWLPISQPAARAAGAREAITGNAEIARSSEPESPSVPRCRGRRRRSSGRLSPTRRSPKSPPGVSDEAAILVSDNLATGWAAIERARLEPGESVAVIGGGAVGQLASLAAQAAGAAGVVLVEPNEARRRFARANGALAAEPGEARALISRLTDGDGADVVIEAVGASATLRSAFDLIRKRGRRVGRRPRDRAMAYMPLARCFAEEITLSFAIGDAIRLRPEALQSHPLRRSRPDDCRRGAADDR